MPDSLKRNWFIIGLIAGLDVVLLTQIARLVWRWFV